ncbi:hypothetical protein ACI3LY_001012 [Candidozyma auris]|uniref:Uncharacterized protein n=2 Tax=Candidozyma auris TaxID=498019 RepID=A0A2H1A6U2_CANAR|nr:hypothetical protein QG37_05749 [[Candida] auris]PIS58595.1 hypothetical protein B9J08_000041 [[Candida] auris]QWW22939.1 hypothetical protein CA7LBN_001740 [[Candida] auris]
MAPLRFAKSEAYAQVDAEAERQILDAYAETLDESNSEDIYLKHLPIIFHKLNIPHCFTRDIDNCIQWFYDIHFYDSASDSHKSRSVQSLLRQLTLTTTRGGEQDVSDVVDIDKVILFGNRLVKFRDHFPEIKNAWRLFVEASKKKSSGNSNGLRDSDLIDSKLTLKDLRSIKGYLELDDISDSILIDMLGCGTTTLEGQVLNYEGISGGLEVGIKDFAEILGQIGQLD